MRFIEARYEEGFLKPDTPLALTPGERVALVVVRHPDPRHWNRERLATSGEREDHALAEQGLAEWADALDREDAADLEKLIQDASAIAFKNDIEKRLASGPATPMDFSAVKRRVRDEVEFREEFLRCHESQALLEALNRAYDDFPTPEEKKLLRSMGQKQRELAKGEW